MIVMSMGMDVVDDICFIRSVFTSMIVELSYEFAMYASHSFISPAVGSLPSSSSVLFAGAGFDR